MYLYIFIYMYKINIFINIFHIYIFIHRETKEKTATFKLFCHHTNIQYDHYRSTKHALKAIQTHHKDRVSSEALCQHPSLNTHSHFQLKHIFSFTIKYLNNTLATRKTFINSLSPNHHHALSVYIMKLCSI